MKTIINYLPRTPLYLTLAEPKIANALYLLLHPVHRYVDTAERIVAQKFLDNIDLDTIENCAYDWYLSRIVKRDKDANKIANNMSFIVTGYIELVRLIKEPEYDNSMELLADMAFYATEAAELLMPKPIESA